jgi:hypothetical protein
MGLSNVTRRLTNNVGFMSFMGKCGEGGWPRGDDCASHMYSTQEGAIQLCQIMSKVLSVERGLIHFGTELRITNI